MYMYMLQILDTRTTFYFQWLEIVDVRANYQRAFEKEVKEFSESIRQKVNKGLKGHALVGEVLREWECIVNRVRLRVRWGRK